MTDIKLLGCNVRLVDGIGQDRIYLMRVLDDREVINSLSDLINRLAEHAVVIKNITFGNKPKTDLLMEVKDDK